VGRDVIDSGPAAMQLKFGLRIAELRATTRSLQTASETNLLADFLSADTNVSQDSTFIGAGPRFGVEGAVPIGPAWTFDYLGDAAALFGTQKFERRQSIDNIVLINPAGIFSFIPPIIDSTQKFATVFNADIQVGVSYWMSQSMKLSLSYRLDAYFNALTSVDAKNDPTKLQQINRYTHGPRVALTAQF
jgi:hypothetical protein